jgi:hypothetical protein
MDEDMAWVALQPLPEDRQVRGVFTGEHCERARPIEEFEEGAEDFEPRLGGEAARQAQPLCAMPKDSLEVWARALLGIPVDERHLEVLRAHD